MLLPKLPWIDLQNGMVFHVSLSLIKEITLQQVKRSSGPALMEFTYRVSHHAVAAGLIEWWDGLLTPDSTPVLSTQ